MFYKNNNSLYGCVIFNSFLAQVPYNVIILFLGNVYKFNSYSSLMEAVRCISRAFGEVESQTKKGIAVAPLESEAATCLAF